VYAVLAEVLVVLTFVRVVLMATSSSSLKSLMRFKRSISYSILAIIDYSSLATFSDGVINLMVSSSYSAAIDSVTASGVKCVNRSAHLLLDCVSEVCGGICGESSCRSVVLLDVRQLPIC